MGMKKDRELVDKLCEIDHGLTEWEMDFIEGIAVLVYDDKRPLSNAQHKMAAKIKREKG